VALHVLAVAGGLLVLAVASDSFVLGAARVAAIARVPEVIVGSVVIGFGTGLPELLTSVLAAGQGSTSIAAGSVIGSNTVNATLVMGCATLVASPSISSRVLRREAPLAMAAVLVFGALVVGELTRTDGAVLLAAFLLAVAVILRREVHPPAGRAAGDTARDAAADPEVADEAFFHQVEVDYVGPAPPRLPVEILRTLGGLAGTLGGAQLLVWGALGIATSTGVSQAELGFTVVALGTSLPELVSGVQAARRGRTELVIGNVLGSNLFNALAVGGLVGLIGPGRVPAQVSHLPNLVMVLTMAAMTAWMFSGRRLHRIEGVGMLAAYAAAVGLSLL
jgi:cation:H+ antiporter